MKLFPISETKFHALSAAILAMTVQPNFLLFEVKIKFRFCYSISVSSVTDPHGWETI